MPYSELLKGRVSLPGQIYLVTTATLGRRPLFANFWLGRTVVRAMRAQDDGGASVTVAFVVMPDHCHWLLQITGREGLSAVVKAMKGASGRAISAAGGGVHAVWQRGFHDHALRAHEDVRRAARYVIGNPLRAGLVRSIAEYSLWDAKWL